MVVANKRTRRYLILNKEKRSYHMKLQIKYNLSDFEKALNIAQQTAEYADILEVGSLLIFQEGAKAITTFKKEFPDKEIYADAKISDKGEEAVKIFAQAGARFVSVSAGAHYTTITKAASTATEHDVKLVLDIINAQYLAQVAFDAATLGAHAILLHRRLDGGMTELENAWQRVRDNTDLPLYIEGKINKEILQQITPLKPTTVIIGSAITNAKDPAQEANRFRSLIK